MANKLNNTRHLNIALLGGDHFARQGIAALLKNIVPAMQITASIDNYAEIENDTRSRTGRRDFFIRHGEISRGI